MEQSVDAAWLDIVARYDETAVAPPQRVAGIRSVDNACSHWALAFGLAGLVPTVSMVTLPIGLPFAALALLLGVLGLRTANRIDGRGRRRAVAGMCLAAAPTGMLLSMSILSLLPA